LAVLTFRELRLFTSFMTAVLFTFYSTRVTSKHTGLLQNRAKLRFGLLESTSNAVLNGLCLSAESAAGDAYREAVAIHAFGDLQRLQQSALRVAFREIVFESFAIDD